MWLRSKPTLRERRVMKKKVKLWCVVIAVQCVLIMSLYALNYIIVDAIPTTANSLICSVWPDAAFCLGLVGS